MLCFRFIVCLFVLFRAMCTECAPDAAPNEGLISIGGYPSIQEAINSNPGKILFVPPGDHLITRHLEISTDGTGLAGTGRIIQAEPGEPILVIEKTRDVRIQGITLTRKEGSQDSEVEGIRAVECTRLHIDDVSVIANRSRSASILVRDSTNCRIQDCLIRNYMTLSVDDRTGNPDLGYAFKCIDGTGIQVLGCHGTLLSENQIIEEELLPTPEVKQKHDLGTIFKHNEKRGALIDEEYWNAKYFPAWHQGAAIQVGGQSDFTRMIGNHIENAAQGIDNHSDHAIISANVIDNAFLGMKAMHGSRNVIITGNHFSKNDIWSIMLMPGTISHAAEQASGDTPAKEPNVDGGTVVANNIISDFGYGHAYWNWKYDGPGSHCCPIALLSAQKTYNPPLRDVVIMGNVVYNTTLDEQPIDGKSEEVKPRYKYAVYIATDRWQPQNLHFNTNIFHPGEFGVCNTDIQP